MKGLRKNAALTTTGTVNSKARRVNKFHDSYLIHHLGHVEKGVL